MPDQPARRIRLMVTGHARHGKDTLCEALRPLRFASSSLFVCSRVVYPVLGPRLGYQSISECYADRGNHRPEWKRLIWEYNAQDPARLSREIFVESDIYCGIRDIREFRAARSEGLFDLAIWVDAGFRHPPEPESSITITPEDCDLVVLNTTTRAALVARARRLLQSWGLV